jgi:hypothetical protein
MKNVEGPSKPSLLPSKLFYFRMSQINIKNKGIMRFDPLCLNVKNVHSLNLQGSPKKVNENFLYIPIIMAYNFVKLI